MIGMADFADDRPKVRRSSGPLAPAVLAVFKTFHVQTQPGTGSYVGTITAYIGSLGESIPLHVVA
jgi:hypothetical protein